jgi:hypothetical protein
MRTPAPRTSRALLVLLGGALFSALAAGAACSDTNGVTPMCDNNITDAGADSGLCPDPNGCYMFATCAASPSSPAACCVGPDGGPLGGNDLASCLYGYGACTTFTSTTDMNGNMTYTCGGQDGG